MCGIAGIARSGRDGERRGVDAAMLARMAATLRHRGPDGSGVYAGARVGLAHARLSIVDVAGGAQPMGNEDGQVLVTYNGEVYNHLELRAELEVAGHRFRTRCDTEVLVHAYEQWGPSFLHRLNGQFAFALYDRRRERLLLARDRFGVRPLVYAVRGGTLYFASEAKALFATGEVEAAPDLLALDETFTLWAPRAPRTAFRGVSALEPGTYAVWRDGRLDVARWYELRYPDADAARRPEPPDAVEELDALLRSAVSLRMRADVPVGAYLSGGLDSSITAALAAARTPLALRTFSVAFDDPRLDESAFQRLVAERIGSRHAVERVGGGAIAAAFPDVVWHAETPLVRTAAAPMYVLARLTRERGITVVLTGEGADEVFLGYDLFKEAVVREFCLRRPDSAVRPRLLDRLYPYLAGAGRGDFWRRFFLDAGGRDDPLFSHLPRILLTSRIREFYSAAMRDALAGADVLAELRHSLPADFARWSTLDRAAYLEASILLPSYLLGSQGERMGMAHGVEGRFPFLDHRLFEFAAALPARSKLRGLHEKDILRRWSEGVVPAVVRERPKQPYRAPDAPAFFGADAPEYVEALLGEAALRQVGVFEPAAVAGLLRRCRAGRVTGFAENQALVAILSTQLWHDRFLRAASAPPALPPASARADAPPRAPAALPA
jgi:asparagine synthase (glutamine-hydrolysing)